MTRRHRHASIVRRVAKVASMGALGAFVGGALVSQAAWAAGDYPITPKQRSTAQQVASAGVPLSELSANAPDQYTVKSGDTLWDISKMYLRSPWRWPELWGMNLQQIRNPHLIYPGQVLFLEKTGDRARLRVGQQQLDNGMTKLSPRMRTTDIGSGGIPSIPFNLIEPFLNEGIVLKENELATAPRIVASQEGRVILGRGDRAYVRGELNDQREWRIFRSAKPLKDPTTGEVLGYEAQYVGAAEYQRQGESRPDATGKTEIVPATFMLTSVRQEAGVGDRLAVVPAREFTNYAPHAPQSPMAGQIIGMYGDALTGGQNQIVSLNKGAVDGMERGHVLALWHAGRSVIDTTDTSRPTIKLPDERHGMLFVFRVFDRVSYALILSVAEPVVPGDRFTQP